MIIINAEKVRFTGNKVDQKEYLSYSLYREVRRALPLKKMLATFPIRVLEKSVRGMLPKTKLGDAMYKKLFVYEGSASARSSKA